ncbi:NAD(P)/FAD-dependent oxidoreductase [Rossellomorea aquimaris]|uniref:NAD(P)/FAD-dependent oxidoreductase n=1 Tax=Rossellomorea aquimaris TaxID=189382 RepID=UPI0007D06F6D|nr:FAD-dependent oxidoreductase [Rossellomorea aquimaris]
MNVKDVVLIGGGLSGIMAASILKRNGIENFIILEKSKSVGGRLATRRIGEGKADHGAQFFTVRSKELQDEVEKWLQAGWIKKWFGHPYPRYTSTDGMNTLTKKLAQHLPTKLNSQVLHVREKRDGPLEIEFHDGDRINAKHVIITPPAPQAFELIDSEFDKKQLNQISFAPSLVGLFTLEKESAIPSPGHLDEQLPDGVERIVDHQKKGISKTVTISVYMTGIWAEKHYEESDQSILEKIKAIVEQYTGPNNSLVHCQLKRWKYAEAKEVFHSPYIELGERGKIIVCGDAFLRENDEAGRTRFESAFLSGISAGERMVDCLKG